MLRRAAFAALLLVAVCARAAAAPPTPVAPPRYDRVEIASTKTSIYVGSVTMTMPVFHRHDGAYESTYAAKVFPYFFYNETGRLLIDVPDEALARIARGEAIDFHGRGIRADGTERRVEGRATPTDSHSGKIKVRVFVSKRIQLIFNTTYRFVDPEHGS